MKETNKWSVRDVITTVLLSAVLIVIQLVVNMVCMANDFVSMLLSVGITMFLCAPVYMLMVSRIGKRFVTLIYMTLLGVIFLLMGNWFLLPYFIVTGVICEVILWKRGACGDPKRMTAAWTAASLLYNGVNLLPIWFFWDTYYDFALASGMEQSYIDSFGIIDPAGRIRYGNNLCTKLLSLLQCINSNIACTGHCNGLALDITAIAL